MKKIILVIILICCILTGCASENEAKPVEKDNTNEWSAIAENPNRYIEIMILLGENFKSHVYEEEDFHGLDDKELMAVKGVYKYYQEYTDLPDDFKSAFTEFSKKQGYDYFSSDTEKEELLYNSLSKSFEIGWMSDDTYHLDLKETKDTTKDETAYETTDIDGQVFTFDNATYVVNGIEITFHSVEFDKTDKSLNGYEMVFDYSVKNTNKTKATLKFAMSEGQFRCKKGNVVLSLSSMNAGSNKYESSPVLEANEEMNKLVMFHAVSNRAAKRINGVDYDVIEIGNIYSDEHVEMDIVITGWIGETSESSTITFNLN